MNFHTFSRKHGKLGLLLLIIPLLIVFFVLSITVFPAATLRIAKVPQSFEKTLPIAASVSATSDDLTTLPIEVISIENNTSQTISSTQEKDSGVGKATGKMTLYNKTEAPIVVPAGTGLSITRDGNSLTYLTNSSVTVAGKTNSISGISWGNAEASVTAEAAGTQYNLTNQGSTQFSVKGFDSANLAATMTPASTFTGGTSKKAKVVAKADIDKAKTDLMAALKQKSITDFNEKYRNTSLVLTTDPEIVIVSEKPSVAIGAEADTFDYEMFIEAKFKIISNANIEKMVTAIVQKEIGTTTKTSEFDDLKSEYSLISSDASSAQVQVKMSAKFYKSYDETELKKEIYGKSLSEVNSLLSAKEGLKIVRIDLFPQYLPESIRKFPSDPSKIDLKIEKSLL